MKRQISVSDVTMTRQGGESLSFREKIELSKLLDRLGVTVIEMPAITDPKADILLIKSLASAVKDSTLAVPVDVNDPESVNTLWNALKTAAHPRLQVMMPVSTVQMEFICHKKPAAILKSIAQLCNRCSELCPDVEFTALDFSRSEKKFLLEAITAATDNGATTVTALDMAGNLLPDEFYTTVKEIKDNLPEGVRLGVECSNEMYMADACAIAAIKAGADEIKTSSFGNKTADLKRITQIVQAKGDILTAETRLFASEVQTAVNQIKRLFDTKKPKYASSVKPEEHDRLVLEANDSKKEMMEVVTKLGYELSEEDQDKVYDAFLRLSSISDKIEAKELDAIITSVAFQVPPTYVLDKFVINSGNTISATCHIRLRKQGEILESVCIGDGPVDAAFQAIDKLTGEDYELDDFQIQSVTEGREAMGEAIVKLRHEGSLYSGRGISTDIIASSVMAYISAVNRIAYEQSAQ